MDENMKTRHRNITRNTALTPLDQNPVFVISEESYKRNNFNTFDSKGESLPANLLSEKDSNSASIKSLNVQRY